MDQPNSTSLLMKLVRPHEEDGAWVEVPPAEGPGGDRPEVVKPLADEMAEAREREDASRELTRLGILPLPGDGDQYIPLAGSEPVPGYRLVQRLGSGGSGEVWRAIGPGGFPVALKFVRLTEGARGLETTSPESLRSARETNLRSLELVRELRHPHLLTMFGAWERDGLLIIGMELADRTLMDRLDEAIGAGLPGIPRAELIEMMRQAARGIDYLNTPGLHEADREGAGIQHRDVKPQNLLLVGDVVKLGDFGLAKLRDGQVSKTGSLTATYAAPELFQGKTSGRSDQYSLAVTYCQLRGGALPFGGSLYEVMLGHYQGKPDLDMIPEAERPAVARGLAKDPEDRWPDCRALIEAIAAGVDPAGGRAARRPARGVAALAGALALASASYLAAPSAGPDPDPDRRDAARPPAPAWAMTLPTPPAVTGVRGPVAVAPSRPLDPAPDREVAVAPASVPDISPPDLDPDPAAPRLAEIIEVAAGVKRWATAEVATLARAASRLTATLEDLARAARTGPVTPRDRAVAKAGGPDAPPPDHQPDPPRPPEVAAVPGPAGARDPGGEPARAPADHPAPPPPRAATIEVLMPSATAELAVRGAVGRGQPDEWYGPRRVIHTPPMGKGADYLVGAFWLGPSGVPSTRNVRLNVEPGMTYEVDLRPAQPNSRPIARDGRPLPLPQGPLHEGPRHRPDPGDPVLRK